MLISPSLTLSLTPYLPSSLLPAPPPLPDPCHTLVSPVFLAPALLLPHFRHRRPTFLHENLPTLSHEPTRHRQPQHDNMTYPLPFPFPIRPSKPPSHDVHHCCCCLRKPNSCLPAVPTPCSSLSFVDLRIFTSFQMGDGFSLVVDNFSRH